MSKWISCARADPFDGSLCRSWAETAPAILVSLLSCSSCAPRDWIPWGRGCRPVRPAARERDSSSWRASDPAGHCPTRGEVQAKNLPRLIVLLPLSSGGRRRGASRTVTRDQAEFPPGSCLAVARS